MSLLLPEAALPIQHRKSTTCSRLGSQFQPQSCLNSEMTAAAARVGERRSYDGALCTVRYIGEVAGTTGSWLGVEWDDPSRGKHDGQHKGVRYFSCRSPAKNQRTGLLIF
jgi:hypothetical protein